MYRFICVELVSNAFGSDVRRRFIKQELQMKANMRSSDTLRENSKDY